MFRHFELTLEYLGPLTHIPTFLLLLGDKLRSLGQMFFKSLLCHTKTLSIHILGFHINLNFGYTLGGETNLETNLCLWAKRHQLSQNFSQSVYKVEWALRCQSSARRSTCLGK